MKVLFISSGNQGNISTLVKKQGDTLIDYDSNLSVTYFLVEGKGLLGYLRSIPGIRQKVKQYNPDIIHAHYSFCGIVAVLAFVNRPIITSMMGSDVKLGKILNFITRIFSTYFWEVTIVKSEDMKSILGISDIKVVPNGVDFNLFYPIDKHIARAKIGWELDRKIILFASNPDRFEKNWKLAEEAIRLLDSEICVKYLSGIPSNEIVYYYNAADVVLLTSLWEGSPNVIKEAMACNAPIVSTDVGDVKHNLKGVNGCYVCDFNKENISSRISQVIYSDEKKSNGRPKLVELGLDSKVVAQRIVDMYKFVKQ